MSQTPLSAQKVLSVAEVKPPVHTTHQQPLTPRIITQSPATHSNNSMPTINAIDGYDPYFQEYCLMAEYNQVQNQKIPGVYVMPSALSPFVWNGFIFVREGLYQEGVFRFTMTIPDTYPDSDCPQLLFDFPIFHPIIHPVTGDLDVKRGFPKWRRNVNHLWQVLMYVRRIFYKIDTANPWNKEAANLYEQDMDLFKKKVAETVGVSQENVKKPPSSDDPYALNISPLDDDTYQEARKQMLHLGRSASEESNRPSGLSWMHQGSSQIFSREDAASA
ncbi:hypothetical protein SNE40_013335 [Patella caerulea]|uniref:UBC core domain-containing protein n=1 Tax=Patella caerulea TaxID=87958 RepID=A0AAN8JM66_PATCE